MHREMNKIKTVVEAATVFILWDESIELTMRGYENENETFFMYGVSVHIAGGHNSFMWEEGFGK